VAMLFANGFEDDVDWKHVSAEGVHHWLGRVWRAVHDAADGRSGAGTPDDGDPVELRRLTHRTVRGVTDDLERHRFNTAIAKLMTLTNEIRRTVDGGGAAAEAAGALVPMLAPFAPFISDELWRGPLSNPESVHVQAWPGFDPELAREETVTLVVQVDGKVRDRIEVAADADEDASRELALSSPNVRRALEGRRQTRVVVRAPKLVNVVSEPA
jgi:leucyl-tRNA synthetase